VGAGPAPTLIVDKRSAALPDPEAAAGGCLYAKPVMRIPFCGRSILFRPIGDGENPSLTLRMIFNALYYLLARR
jgi:hypothetical protein